ncbi:MAG: hypothetical protein ACYCS4_07945 [Acidimicrobiales bacterium]
MRNGLRPYNGKRLRFSAAFERFGTKAGYRGPERTILLTDVRLSDSDEILADHLWFTCGKIFDRLFLRPGDQIAFDARVGIYDKGYHGRRAEELEQAWSETDYRLERPTRAVKDEVS